ncbi:hypothetical protein BDP27DRAFT_756318 [Rhodocollybia butyracea]|uniref:Uncharacterized protein n=1 Tax=Rhodocollybia butyracea TaxID=206335 RepID=A0A9P5U8I4_9AGAR|nr:hypothetical protein BDP27DRAFT_756318 [Rhodocollybia butyracea]
MGTKGSQVIILSLELLSYTFGKPTWKRSFRDLNLSSIRSFSQKKNFCSCRTNKPSPNNSIVHSISLQQPQSSHPHIQQVLNGQAYCL